VALFVVTAEDAKPVAVPQAEPAVIVKLALEISKKILPTASTLILAVVVGVFGITSASVPSLGVLAANTVGNVWPPSVLNEIFTLAQLTGDAVVLATAHVIVCVELPAYDTAVLGTLTANGPEAALTVTTISVNWVWPTLYGDVELYGALSLTVSLKFNVLATELNASVLALASPPVKGPLINAPANMVDNLGKYLVGEVVGANEIQLGPVVLVALATLLAPVVVVLSFCSQL